MSQRIAITGVTRGLGRALAEYYAAEGHTILGCGRSREHVDSLQSQLGQPHAIQVCDVRSETDVAEWVKSILASGGPPDLLINNAALMNEPAELWEVPSEEFEAMLAVNIAGTFYTIKHLVPAMIDAGRGVIVNLSSGWGRSTSPQVAPYCATKYAIEGLTQALAQELPSPLAAVPLNPGVIDTDMLRGAWGENASHYDKPDEWAQRAGPQILSFNRRTNGQPMSVR